MREPRNPFRLQASEHIDSDETFIRLFSPEVLDLFNNRELWRKPQIIRSAPGGGKTSLLRLFTPSSLLTVHALRTGDYTKDLFSRLTSLGAVDDNGPSVIGLFLSCSQTFATLDDLNIDSVRKWRLLLSLLNARITLSALQGILLLKRLQYPDDLSQIKIDNKELSSLPNLVNLPCNGKELYSWAMELEKNVCEALDSLGPLTDSSLPGHESLISLRLLTENSLKHNGQPIVTRVLLMLDDVHRLTEEQRRLLINDILSTRYPVSVWISERLEALETDELLSSGASIGRDYDQIIHIEDAWRVRGRKSFEKVIASVADRRARDAKDTDVGSFLECLQGSLDGTDWQEQFQVAADTVSKRVQEMASGRQRYVNWINELKKNQSSPREEAIAWRKLEILIERDRRKSQMTFDFTLSIEELEHRDKSDITAAAELFLCRDFKIPYYYSLSRLAVMASSNIEQFLWLAGDLFEESVSAILLKQSGHLSPVDQERIIKKTIKKRWNAQDQKVKHGTKVRKFLEAIGKFSRWETDKPNAPYAPGVTGIAISMSDRIELTDKQTLQKNQELLELAQVFKSCIINNLLEITLNYKCKGQYWMLLYLNRMLCVHFGLPLQYGGWREKTLNELCTWLSTGFVSPNGTREMFK